MLDALTSPTAVLVKTALDGLTLQQRVIANNIANANSEGFLPQRVDFESALRDIERSNGAFSNDSIKAQLHRVAQGIENGEYIHNDSRTGVELDVEMTQMNTTVLKYQALIQGLIQSGSLMQMAITGEGNK